MEYYSEQQSKKDCTYRTTKNVNINQSQVHRNNNITKPVVYIIKEYLQEQLIYDIFS